MCGIVGYVGPQPCAQLLLDGLKRLEYRGYDSAGLAVHDGDRVNVLRVEGKLFKLEQALASQPLPGSTGIGHTRWATHGRPNETNAHPHVVDGIAVVHNGIIENHLTLRRRLSSDGAVFSSETDTEIIAHLVARRVREGRGLEQAVRGTLGELEGSYAVAVVSQREPGMVVIAKNASPLVVGLGEGEMFAASDIPAILPYTRNMIFLDEGDMGVLTTDGVALSRRDGTRVERRPKVITWSAVQAEKGGFKHFMLKEIHEQPRAVEDTLRGRVSLERAEVNPELMGLDAAEARRIRRVVFVACGTSYHACLLGRYWVEGLARCPAEVELASEYRARGPMVDPNDLVVAVSQSGETLDTLEAVKVAREGGSRVLAVANVLDSAIPRTADGALYTHAGPEIGVASTKCFVAQLAALVLLAIYLGRRRGTLREEQARALLQGLLEIPSLMRRALDCEADVADLAKRYAQCRDFLFLGRGLSFPVALEGALKLKEISYIHAEGYAAGEMKHGPIALIDQHMPVVVVMPRDSMFDKILGNLQEARARNGMVIAVTDEDEHLGDELCQKVVKVPTTLPELTPLLTIVPLQLLAYYTADFKGTDVDQPRNLAKTVTVE
jgi:glucosamine--fructose-6-phosphate aminotransferase (isomerizing)